MTCNPSSPNGANMTTTKPLSRVTYLSATLARLSRIALAAALTLTTVARQPVQAFEDFDVPAHKRTRLGLYFDAVMAHAAVSENRAKVLFIDVRTPEELETVGVPTMIDANVPFMHYVTPLAWNVGTASFRRALNPWFVSAVDTRLAAKRLTRSDIVVLICRSGDRSARAADLLAEAGYRRVYSVVDGFEGDAAPGGPLAGQRAINGWKVSRLPWRYLANPQILTLGPGSE